MVEETKYPKMNTMGKIIVGAIIAFLLGALWTVLWSKVSRLEAEQLRRGAIMDANTVKIEVNKGNVKELKDEIRDHRNATEKH